MEFKLKKFKKSLIVSRLANIHYFEFTKDYHTENDWHSFRELIYVDSGSIYISSEDYSGKLDKNCMIIHKNFEQHSLICNENIAPNVIIIGFECTCSMLDVFSLAPVVLTTELVRMLTDVVLEGRTVFKPPYDIPNIKDMKKYKDYPFGADQMIKLRLEIFLICLIRKNQNMMLETHIFDENKKMREIQDYIDDNFNKSFNLDKLCFLFGTNKTTLCKNFKETYGITIRDYVNHIRIKEAKIRLRNGQESITQIAYDIGYNSVYYFSRIFKKYEHLSPLKYVTTIKSKFGS